MIRNSGFVIRNFYTLPILPILIFFKIKISLNQCQKWVKSGSKVVKTGSKPVKTRPLFDKKCQKCSEIVRNIQKFHSQNAHKSLFFVTKIVITPYFSSHFSLHRSALEFILKLPCMLYVSKTNITHICLIVKLHFLFHTFRFSHKPFIYMVLQKYIFSGFF